MQSTVFGQTAGTAPSLLYLLMIEEGFEVCLRIVEAKKCDESVRLLSLCCAVKRK